LRQSLVFENLHKLGVLSQLRILLSHAHLGLGNSVAFFNGFNRTQVGSRHLLYYLGHYCSSILSNPFLASVRSDMSSLESPKKFRNGTMDLCNHGKKGETYV
jgi:hypothetical protein